MTTINEATCKTLQEIIEPARVSVADADRQQHGRDQSSHESCLPDIVVWPQNREEVQAILRYAHEARLPVTPWGAGTSIEGNPIPVQGGLVLDLRQMNQIVTVHEQDFQVTVQPGVLYKNMNETLARSGLFFAPDPGANASIGGMIANNAAGSRTVKYGATKDNVLALEVVLANGDLLRTGCRAVKQSAGYDLTHLFIGSEGTLGVVTEATLKLAPLPSHFSAVVTAFPSVNEAAQVVFEVIGNGLGPAALEFLDAFSVRNLNLGEGMNLVESPNLLMEFNGASEAALREELSLVEEICREHHCQHFEAGLGREARNRLWRARHALFEVLVRNHPGQTYLLTDVAVPISQYPSLVAATADIMAELQVNGSIIGHAGDGNLHTVFFFAPTDEVARQNAQRVNDYLVETAISMNGTSTGEHGVGLGKQKYMLQEHGPVALNLMRQLKATLDPHGILNPGKVLG